MAGTAPSDFGNFIFGESPFGGPAPIPVPPFPAIGAEPTTLQQILKSYLYQEYSDDDNLQAFVAAYNAIAQYYLAQINALNLPVYTSDTITGALLDWVAEGLYGLYRPDGLPSGIVPGKGPYNTFAYNTLPYNARTPATAKTYYATSDDTFKRIITWHFYKGDGKYFNVPWLKRRIMRFLNGVNGTSPNIDNTYQISVTFSGKNQVNIRILNGIRSLTGGALYSRFAYNTVPYNTIKTSFIAFPPLTEAPIFAAAVAAGVLELPFQYNFIVTY